MAGNEESISVPADNNSIALPSQYYHLLAALAIVFQTPVISARLMNLHTGAFIKPHRDYNMGYEDGIIRLHVPIITHDDVEFIPDEEKLTMLPG